MVGLMFMWSSCILLLLRWSEKTVGRIMVTFVSGNLSLKRFLVQPGLWPSPKSHHRKASYSTAGEVSSLRFLTNYTLQLRRKPSELLAGRVFLARVKGKLL